MRAAPRILYRLAYATPLAVALIAIGPLFGQEPCCAPAVDITGGGWSGRWESCTTGHNGPLKARFIKEDCSHYKVVFRGRFRKVIPFRYAVTLNVVGQDGCTIFLAGDSKVPFYGLFHYTAEVTETHFLAHYWSEKNCKEADRGTFEMWRCGHGKSRACCND